MNTVKFKTTLDRMIVEIATEAGGEIGLATLLRKLLDRGFTDNKIKRAIEDLVRTGRLYPTKDQFGPLFKVPLIKTGD